MTDTEDVGLRLGGAIRARRHLLGLTLVDVATQAGLSHPFLSQLERGLARPSMRSLTAIAATLGTTAQALMAEAELPAELAGTALTPAGPGTGERPTAPVEPVSVVRSGSHAGPPVDSPGGLVRALVRGERAMLPVEYIGAPREFDEYIRHDGEEFVYVARGTIEVDIEGELHVASAGDSIYYAGGLAHRWRALSDEEVHLVVVQQNLRRLGPRACCEKLPACMSGGPGARSLVRAPNRRARYLPGVSRRRAAHDHEDSACA